MSTEIVVNQPLPPDQSAEALIRVAIERNVPVETMERLLAMRTQIRSEQAKQAFDHALAEFQSECPTIQKTREVGSAGRFGYKYAALEDIVYQLRPFLQKHQFSYSWDAVQETNSVTAVCTITHALGHSRSSSLKVPIDPKAAMNEPQKVASALTFAKRYSFLGVLGVTTGDEDDDARKAGGDPAVAEQQARWQAKPEPAKDPAKERLRPLWELLKPIRGEKPSWDQAEKWLEAHKIWAGDVRKIPDSAMIDVLDKAQISLGERSLL